MESFTLEQWAQTPVEVSEYPEEVVTELLEKINVLQEFCAIHDIQMVCLAQTQGNCRQHTLHGGYNLTSAGKAPPELLMASVLLTNGLADGIGVIEAIIDFTPERYAVPHLKVVKSDE